MYQFWLNELLYVAKYRPREIIYEQYEFTQSQIAIIIVILQRKLLIHYYTAKLIRNESYTISYTSDF